MYTKQETEYQNNPVIEKVIEDHIGGGTIARADLVNTDELKPGAIVGPDTDGLFHVLKTAKVHADSATGTIQIEKGSEMKVGDFVGDTKLALASSDITAIDISNEDYDVLTLTAAIGSLTAGDVLVVTEGVATAGNGVFLYIPFAITMASVDLTNANQQAGLLVRGTVNESLLPYPIDGTLKDMLPLIRFV